MSRTSARPELREKFVSIYSAFLRGDDPSLDQRNFWEELFLLKVNVSYLEKALDELSVEQLLKLKPSFNVIFARCSAALGGENQPICRANALQTLCVLVRCVFRKLSGVDMIDVLVGFERAVTEMQVLIGNISAILIGAEQASLKNLTFKFLLILVSAVDNISQNKMLEYLMANNIFEPLSHILSTPADRDEHGYDCVVLLTFLLNYRKYESANPYIPKLSVLDNELVLNGLGVVISGVLSTVNKKHAADSVASPGWFGSLGSWVGGMFVAEDEVQDHPREAHSIILLSLYEAVHLNRSFMPILTQTHAQVPASPAENSSPAMARMLSNSSGDPASKSISEPVNLLGAFLTSASISMQDIKEGISGARARLCLNILTCICEDQYANAFLHDANMGFPVQLYRARRRHRQLREKVATSKPLACAILDLVTELMLTHMCPKIQVELYVKCLGIIHRLLCYQKRCRIRLAYDWKGLWNALMSVGYFLAQNDKALLNRGNIIDLATQVVNLMNLFITYGDTFLPSPTSYDELYCEMIRNRSSFHSLRTMAEKHASSGTDSAWKASSGRLTQSLQNILTLVEHFLPKIDSHCEEKKTVSLERDQVMEVIRENYGSLTLRLHDNLDYYDKYAEKPHEKAFFTQLMRTMVSEVRRNIALSNLELQSVLEEFTTIR